jgi:hypothetical protein
LASFLNCKNRQHFLDTLHKGLGKVHINLGNAWVGFTFFTYSSGRPDFGIPLLEQTTEFEFGYFSIFHSTAAMQVLGDLFSAECKFELDFTQKSKFRPYWHFRFEFRPDSALLPALVNYN